VNELLTYAVMLDTLVAAYMQFMKVLIKLQEVLYEEVNKVVVTKTVTVHSE